MSSDGLRIVSDFESGGVLPVGDATALGTFRTRLETRTKESNMYASHWVLLKANKPKGEMKVKIGLASIEGGWPEFARVRTPGASHGLLTRGAPRAYTLGPERW